MVEPVARTFVEIGTDLSGFTKGLASVSKGLKKFGTTISGVGKKMSIGITVPIIAIGAASIKSAADMETLTVAFESLLGSSDAAAKVIKDLVEFTAKTPFQLEGVGKAAKQLLAFGVDNDKLITRLKTLGDIAAGANIPLEEMAAIFGKSKAKGKAMTEELLQLSDRGVPVIAVLAENLEVSTEEIFKMASAGKISFPILLKALEDMTKGSGIFADQMDKQSATIAGLFSTLSDNVSLALAELGKDLAKAVKLKKLIESLTKSIQGLTTSFGDLEPETKQMIFIFAGMAAALGPLLVLVGGMSIALGALGLTGLAGVGILVGGFLTLAAPIAAVALAIGGLIALGVSLINNWGNIGIAAEVLGEILTEHLGTVGDKVSVGFKGMGNALIEALNDVTRIVTSSDDLLLATWEDVGKDSVKAYEKGIAPMAGIAEAAVIKANRAAKAAREAGTVSDIELEAILKLKVEGLEESRIQEALFGGRVIDPDILGREQFTQELDLMDQGLLELGEGLGEFGELAGGIFDGLSISILSFGEVVLGVFDQMSTGIGDAVADAVVDGESLAAGLQSVMKSLGKTIISSLAKIAIQRLAAAVSGVAVNQALTASEVATGGTRTFAGQFAATSSAPFPINLTAPAVAASALGQYSAGVSAAGGGGAAFFAEGGIVTGPTLAVIGEGSENEAVLPLSRLDSLINTSAGNQVIQIFMDEEMIAEASARGMPDVLSVQVGISQT